MPEGHSIYRLARQFDSVFVGETLQVSSPQGRFEAGAALLNGRALQRAWAHGKHLFLGFGGPVLHVHLGLYGAFSFGGDEQFTGASSIGAPRRIGEREVGMGGAGPEPYTGPPDPVGAVRVRLVGAHGWADLRGATTCEVLTAPEVDAVLARLGPDPINPSPGRPQGEPNADAERFVNAVVRRKTPIGQLLMAQEVIAGVGNIYRAESLFALGLDPRAPGSSVPRPALRALWDVLAAWMRLGTVTGRIITTAPLACALDSRELEVLGAGWGGGRGGADASPSVPGLSAVAELSAVPEAEAHWVYKRAGEPCRVCGTPIALAEMAGRKVYWCPGCQVG